MDVMRGLEESGSSAPLPGVENLMLHFTPYAEDWSKLPVIVSGEGCYVTDDKGNTYIDGLAGLFTTQVGHGRSELAEVAAQADEGARVLPQLEHAPPQVAGACGQDLRDSAGGPLLHLLRLLWIGGRRDGDQAGPPVPQGERRGRALQGVSRKIAYHGTTMGALSVTGLPAFKAPFEPLLQGFYARTNTQQDPEGAADAIEEAIEFGPPETVAAVILEPVQNAGGCLVPPPDYWKRVREICDRHGVLLVSDAVICAFGRLGEWFGIERFDVVPDMTSFAKGVTSGYLPMGGVVVNEKMSAGRSSRDNAPMFMHGSTFGGIPSRARSPWRT